MNQSRVRSMAIALSCAALVAVGCSTTTADGQADPSRAAQAIEDPTTEEPTTEEPTTEEPTTEEPTTEEPEVQDELVDSQVDGGSESAESASSEVVEDLSVGALLDGVRVCVRNERTTVDGKPALINLTFEDEPEYRSWESDFIPPGAENCVERQNLVIGIIGIMYTDSPLLEVNVYNPPLFPAAMSINLNSQICRVVDPWLTRDIYDNGFARFFLERQPDSNGLKNFYLVIRDSEGRNNQNRRC